MREKQIKAKKKEKSEGKTTDKPDKSKKKMADKPVKTGTEILIPPKCRLTKTALEFDESISLEEFCKVSDFLISQYDWTRNSHVKFWIGDWMNHALGKFKRRAIKTRAMSFLKQYTYGYLRNIEWVCRSIEPSRRREKLSFSHHQEVAHLAPEDQDIWLDTAERCRPSVKQLRKDIRMVFAIQNGLSQKHEDKLDFKELISESKPVISSLDYKLTNLIAYKARLDSEDLRDFIDNPDFLISIRKLLKDIIIFLNGTDILQKAKEGADEELKTNKISKEIIIGFRSIEQHRESFMNFYNKHFSKNQTKLNNHKSKQEKFESIDLKDALRESGLSEEEIESITTYYHGDKKMSL